MILTFITVKVGLIVDEENNKTIRYTYDLNDNLTSVIKECYIRINGTPYSRQRYKGYGPTVRLTATVNWV